MIVLIVISIALIALLIFWRRNVSLYQQNFGGSRGLINGKLVSMYNTLFSAPTSPLLDLFPNFFNYTANLILKTILFIILAIVKYVFRDITIVVWLVNIAYALPFIISWWMYNNRRAFYIAIPEDQKDILSPCFRPILKASLCIPLYQTLLSILLCVI